MGKPIVRFFVYLILWTEAAPLLLMSRPPSGSNSNLNDDWGGQSCLNDGDSEFLPISDPAAGDAKAPMSARGTGLPVSLFSYCIVHVRQVSCAKSTTGVMVRVILL